MSSENEEQSLNEPSFPYRKKWTVRVFDSMMEQEQEMIRYWATTTSVQRLSNLYQLIKYSFGISDDKVQIPSSRKIRILKDEP